ncbi:MAG: helix-turn-helix domain-containing protein [Candidatus Promineifilaceae bacterium]|jgi:transcriptional regulator with XRE-family HTH domain
MIGIELGERVKQRRLELGMTARELARQTGLSASFISQVERGKTNVSLESLRLIAEKLDASILYFLSESPQNLKPQNYRENDPPELNNSVIQVAERPTLTFPDLGVCYELLTRDLSRKMEAMLGRLSPGTGNVARRLSMPTEEFIYVLSGSLRIGRGTEKHTLNPGDAIYFEGYDLSEIVCASEDEDAVWISVITPPAF